MTGETEFNGNVFSSKCLPITLAARGVKVDLWDAFIGDLLGLPSLGLGRVECCVVATVGCPIFVGSQCERSSSSLCAGRARLWRERANAVCLRHAPAFGVLGISLKATVATDDISRLGGDSDLEIGEPWQGTCVEFSWTPPATALVLREGGDGSLKSGLENLAGKALRGIFGGPAPRPKPDSKTAYWEALPLGPADTPCVHVPVPPGMAPGARLQVLAPQGGAFVVQVPNPPPATILVHSWPCRPCPWRPAPRRTARLGGWPESRRGRRSGCGRGEGCPTLLRAAPRERAKENIGSRIASGKKAQHFQDLRPGRRNRRIGAFA